MKPNTTKYLIFSALLLTFTLLVYCSQAEKEQPMSQQELIQRGAYLVNLGGCNDCHSPKKMTPRGPEPDETILLSGQPANAPIPEIPAGIINPEGWIGLTNAHLSAWAGPWGVSFAANLTPDPQTGIGDWDEEDFIKTLRTGKHLGTGREILPPMPWQNLSKVTDEDLKAMFAYLKSLPAVPNLVPGPIPPSGVAPSGAPTESGDTNK